MPKKRGGALKRRVRRPTDATIRNVKASNTRDEALSVRVTRIEAFLDLMWPGWVFDAKRLL